MNGTSLKTKVIRVLGALLAVIIVALVYLAVYEPRYNGLISQDGDALLFAHRGYGNHAPDNSLAGAEMALSTGLDGVDVDAQFSKDKEVVIFHDVSLERFTSGSGRVDAKSADELQRYDLSLKFDGDFPEAYIKTFEDFVKTVTSQAYLMVELKVSAAGDTGIEKRVNEILAEYDAYDRVFVSSFNPIVLYRLKQIEPRIQTVFIFMDSGWDPKRVAETKVEDRVSLPWYLRNEYARRAIRKIIKPDALSVNHLVDEATIDKLLKAGHPIFLWALNDAEQISWGLEKRPFGIITDEPLLAKNITDAFEKIR